MTKKNAKNIPWNNEDKINEYNKEYNENNKYKQQEYRANNKGILSCKITSVCGSIYGKNKLSRHLKTLKHCEFKNNNK